METDILNAKIKTEEFATICRSCLSKNNLTPLENSFIDMFKRIADVKIDLNEELPKHICYECVIKIKEISHFVFLIKTNDYYLRQIFEISGRKSDVTEDIGNHLSNNSSDEVGSDQEMKFSVETIGEDYKSTQLSKNMIKKEKQKLRGRNTKTFYKNRQFKCNDCGEIFSKRSKFNLHLKSHNTEALYECKACLKKFRHAPNLRRHDNIVHKGIKPFKCEVCGKQFATLLRKKEHVNIHTGERPYVCNFCGLRFKKYSTHYSHEIRHRIKNGELPKSEKIPKKYPRKLPENPSDLECDVCRKRFSSKQALVVHKQIHSGEKSFLCTECGKGFIRKNHLEVHVRIHTGEKPYQCNDCGKHFRQPTAYRNHLLIHKNKRSFKCEICQKTFIQLGHLQNHLKTHTGEKPHKCTFCGKTFAQNGNLKAHARIHTNERPFRCVVCYLGFYDSSSLKKHKKTHTKDEIKVEDSTSINNSCS